MLTLETLALVLALLYLVLAIRQNLWCWAAAIASCGLYLYVFAGAQLYMESGLQVYYIAMAIYGWSQWRPGQSGQSRPVTTWRPRQHALALVAILILTLASGWALRTYTQAAYPFLDSLTTWASILTTVMVARKILENWLYWLAIDSLSIWIYWQRELYQTAGLFALYLVLAVIGYIAWRRDWTSQPGHALPATG